MPHADDGAERETQTLNADEMACQRVTESAHPRGVLGEIEDDMAELRGIADALEVVAERMADTTAPVRRCGPGCAAGDAPGEGLLWAVRELRGRIAVIDARLADG